MNKENTPSFPSLTSFENQLHTLLDESLEAITQREQTTFDEMTKPFGNRLVLFGAGGLGRKTLSGLRKVGIEPLAFADNNPNKWHTSIDGLQVLSPQEAATQFGQTATFVITIWRGNSSERQAARQKQLLDLNCLNVISFGYLFWKYPDIFFPHAYLQLPSVYQKNREKLRELFYLWSDDTSRNEYIAQLKFRLTLDFDGLSSPAHHKQYFPDDLYAISTNETFIDCGAFDGDTILELLRLQPNFSGKILAFEPDQINYTKLTEYVSNLPDAIKQTIITKQAPVGVCGQKVKFISTGTVSSKITDDGETEMNCVCIDQVAADYAPTFIKMDIEGAEIDALNGARETIQRSRPILAICVYHKPDDLWQIPLIISSYVENYRFFLRPHDEEGWELVCYAVPIERLLASFR